MTAEQAQPAELLTLADVARVLRIDRASAYRLRQRMHDLLLTVKLGPRPVRADQADLADWLCRRREDRS